MHMPKEKNNLMHFVLLTDAIFVLLLVVILQSDGPPFSPCWAAEGITFYIQFIVYFQNDCEVFPNNMKVILIVT